MLVFCVLGVLVAPALVPLSDNPASRLATIESLVERGTWRIDGSPYLGETSDRVLADGHFYSTKPPVLPLLGAGAYAALRAVAGLTFAEDEAAVVWFLRVAIAGLPFLLALAVFGRVAGRRIRSPAAWLAGVGALGPGSLLFGYAAEVNNHVPATALLLLSFAGFLRIQDGGAPRRIFLLTGLAASAATVIDLGAAMWSIALGASLLLRRDRLRVGWLLLGAAGPAALHLALTKAVTGSWLPFFSRPELYEYPGSYWNDPKDLDALDEPLPVYAIHSLVGHHGLFAMTPFLLLAVPGLAMLLRGGRADRATGGTILATALGTMAVYWTWGPKNYGGWCMGMRWFLVLVPPLGWAALRWVDERSGSRRVLAAAAALAALGLASSLPALFGPFGTSPWNVLLRSLRLGSLPPW